MTDDIKYVTIFLSLKNKEIPLKYTLTEQPHFVKYLLTFVLIFVILVAATRYISLGSSVGSALAPVLFLFFYWGHWGSFALLTMTAALLIWSHRSNIKRLISGTESKFSFQ